MINVCDREADFFELFDEQRQHPRVDLLVRAKHNRALATQPGKLFGPPGGVAGLRAPAGLVRRLRVACG